jgi:integrase
VGAWDNDGTKVPRIVDSCADCFAWGLTRAQGVCLACYNFANPQYGHRFGECASCRRWIRLKKGHCRLCWHQAGLDRDAADDIDARSKVMLAPWVVNVRHQQLFLTIPAKVVPPPRTAPRRWGEKGRPRKPAPAPVSRPASAFIQPPLFEAPRRDYRAVNVDLRCSYPDNPWLAWAVFLAHTFAEERGWQPLVRRGVVRVLAPILAGHVDGDTIRASDVQPLFDKHSVNYGYVLEILAAMDVLDDDRPNNFQIWLQAKTEQLAPAIARDVTGWMNELRHGGPRTKPRDPATCRNYLKALLPGLTDWSRRYDHLREVGANDIRALIDALIGPPRLRTVTAARSLFSWAKRSRLIFRDPTLGIRGGTRERQVWQPLHQHEIDAAVAAATTPQARLYVALAAIHGARPGQIREMLLDDVDLPNRRLTIAGLQRPMDDLTADLLTQWLKHRRDRWPNTANPHLFVTRESALRDTPPSNAWILNLRGSGVTVERLRIDRQLEEARANRGDPLLQAELFGVCATTAVHYATNAIHLLERPHEATPGTSSRTPASEADTDSGVSWSSA